MAIVVGIAGGTGSGKSTLARRVARSIREEQCCVVSQDNYYRDLSDMSLEARASVNFDHPDAIDSELLASHVAELQAGRSITMPRYDFSSHARVSGGVTVEPRPVIMIEGILVLVWPQLAEQMDIRIYVDTPDDVRLARRVQRDIIDRGRDVDGVLQQYLQTVRPMHEQYGAYSRRKADLIVPGQGNNQVVVRVLREALLQMANGSVL